MADFNLFNIDTDPPTQYTQYDVPQSVNIDQTFTGDVTTIITTVNGNSGKVVGPSITISGGSTGYDFVGSGSVLSLTVLNAATVRSSISAAASGVNTDITQLNGASQVDVSGEYKVDGVQVVTDQQPAIPDAILGTEVTTINLILTALRSHGLIDT